MKQNQNNNSKRTFSPQQLTSTISSKPNSDYYRPILPDRQMLPSINQVIFPGRFQHGNAWDNTQLSYQFQPHPKLPTFQATAVEKFQQPQNYYSLPPVASSLRLPQHLGQNSRANFDSSDRQGSQAERKNFSSTKSVGTEEPPKRGANIDNQKMTVEYDYSNERESNRGYLNLSADSPSSQSIPENDSENTKQQKDSENTKQQTCYNCGVSKTPLWRKTEDNNYLCNACGLYLKIHSTPRPLHLKSNEIKSRKRTKKNISSESHESYVQLNSPFPNPTSVPTNTQQLYMNNLQRNRGNLFSHLYGAPQVHNPYFYAPNVSSGGTFNSSDLKLHQPISYSYQISNQAKDVADRHPQIYAKQKATTSESESISESEHSKETSPVYAVNSNVTQPPSAEAALTAIEREENEMVEDSVDSLIQLKTALSEHFNTSVSGQRFSPAGNTTGKVSSYSVSPNFSLDVYSKLTIGSCVVIALPTSGQKTANDFLRNSNESIAATTPQFVQHPVAIRSIFLEHGILMINVIGIKVRTCHFLTNEISRNDIVLGHEFSIPIPATYIVSLLNFRISIDEIKSVQMGNAPDSSICVKCELMKKFAERSNSNPNVSPIAQSPTAFSNMPQQRSQSALLTSGNENGNADSESNSTECLLSSVRNEQEPINANASITLPSFGEVVQQFKCNTDFKYRVPTTSLDAAASTQA